MAGKAARGQEGPVTLKPVGLSEDGTSILLAKRANAKAGGFRIAVDDRLLDHLEKAVGAMNKAAPPKVQPKPEPPPEPAPRPQRRQPPKELESKLSPKEIQVLLREGKSVAFIAKKAGVPAEWVERFEVPIVWERAGMALRAQRATLFRPRSGRSAVPLGEAVRRNLMARRSSLDAAAIDAGWDSIRDSDTGKWIVQFSFHSRGQDRVAEWEFNPDADEVLALNKLATDLGWVDRKRSRTAR